MLVPAGDIRDPYWVRLRAFWITVGAFGGLFRDLVAILRPGGVEPLETTATTCQAHRANGKLETVLSTKALCCYTNNLEQVVPLKTAML